MEESEDNMSSEDIRKLDSPSSVRKSKKRSLVERELETNLTARVTSPASVGDGLSTSRYGRARRLKTDAELIESQKILLASIKSPGNENTPVKVQSPVYRMHASNSPHKSETPKKGLVHYLDNQIDNIYQENISLSRFSDDTSSPSPAKKFPKVYIRKDLIQNREEEETIMLIKNLFSPTDSASKSSNTNLSDSSLNSTEKYTKQNGHIDNSSVVKTLDFDNTKKKKRDDRDQRSLSKNELFELEAKCPYQVGDLAWARMGTFPFWPCIVTRDPHTEMFVKKKLFGRVERDIVHVTFFGDNGRRSWIVDNMLRNYLGQLEFEATRDKFTVEDKKKDPKLYAAFFISEKKQALWTTSVEEAEALLREPKRLRIDIFYDMLWKSRASKKPIKSGKISSRNNSDVSLSESLYDSLFSEKDIKTDEADSSKNSRNVSDVVTACLDNMAAKTGITKIQRQSHMDRWLQKAKSKTPEKTQAKATTALKVEKPDKSQKKSAPTKLNRKTGAKANKPVPSPSTSQAKPYSFRKRTSSEFKESHPKSIQDNNDNSNIKNTSEALNVNNESSNSVTLISTKTEINDSTDNISQEISPVILTDNDCLPKDEGSVKTVKRSKKPRKNTAAFVNDSEQNNERSDSTTSFDKNLEDSKDQSDVDKTISTVSNVSGEERKSETSESLDKKSIDTPVSTATTSNSENMSSLEINTVPVEDKQPLKTKHQKIKPAGPKLAKPNNSISVSNVDSSQDNLMEVDETLGSVEINQENQTTASKSESLDNSAMMDVDQTNNEESQADGSLSHISETVSNKSVEDNNVTDLKQTENVTIEVSVAEKERDNAINNLQDGVLEHTEKLKYRFKPTRSKKSTSTFLDKSNNTKILRTPKNSSTPDKSKSSVRLRRKKYILENNIDCHSIIEDNQDKKNNKDDTQEIPNIPIENGLSANDESTEDHANNETFNETQHLSESIEVQKNDANLETSIDITSESSYEKTKTSEKNDKTISVEEVAEKSNIQNNGLDNNENGSSRPYVESPTYTQAENEDFFRDLNEAHDSYKELKEKSKRLMSHLQAMREVEKILETEESKIIPEHFEEDETTSEDEPSPEYESLDDEITEDFRKHLKSIESNVKDKKDEELIVKICNEIAEKAKLSPTKYNGDEDNYQFKVAKNDVSINKKETPDPNLNKIKSNTHNVRESKQENKREKTNSHKKANQFSEKEKCLNRSNKIKITDTHDSDSRNKLKINGETDEVHKVVYRTRSSVSNASKERSNFDAEIKSSKVKETRMSCEYDPKVMVIRLERDKNDDNLIDSKNKELVLDNSIKHSVSLTESFNDKEVANNTKENEDRNTSKKSRLSLRRNSPRNKNVESSAQNHSEIKQDRSEDLIKEKLKEDVEVTATKVPKKLDIKNDARETSIPEPAVNGYHNVRKFADTPELTGDTDFDVDAVSLSSEDSEVSMPNSVETVPKRNLRSRTETTFENALKNPKFLMYLELKQDYLMELHPELNEEEVLSYVYKTWEYEEELKSETKKTIEVRKQETPSRSKKSKKSLSKSIENYFSETPKKTVSVKSVDSEVKENADSIEAITPQVTAPELSVDENTNNTETPAKQEIRTESPDVIASKSTELSVTEGKCKVVEPVSTPIIDEIITTPKRSSRVRTSTKRFNKEFNEEVKSTPKREIKKDRDIETESIDSEDSEISLRQLRSRVLKEANASEVKETTAEEKGESRASDEMNTDKSKRHTPHKDIKDEADETASTVSDNEPLVKQKKKRIDKNTLKDPGFVQYLEMRRDAIMDENPLLTQDEIVEYLHKTWIYEESSKTALEKNDELEQQTNLVKGLNNNEVPPKKIKRKPKPTQEKQAVKEEDASAVTKDKPRRRIAQPFYNENYSDIEDELEVFEIFKMKKMAKAEKGNVSPATAVKEESPKASQETVIIEDETDQATPNVVDEIELYFEQLTKPKPNVFKGLVREKICEVCEGVGNLVKCKGCFGMFHVECERRRAEPEEKDPPPTKGRKKKRKSIRKPKEESDNGDDKSQDLSADVSIEEVPPELCSIDAEFCEAQLEAKMKELLAADNELVYSSDESESCIKISKPGRCDIIDVPLKRRVIDVTDFKCSACARLQPPPCFVCNLSGGTVRCQVAHCHRHYHIACLQHWPQAQFSAGGGLWCPRHVCHSCVSDDPRCRARFSGDKLARCSRCPATYHAYNRCLPAGSRLLTASHIVCPRHTEQKAGRVPCHVNTGWCFICAQGGSLICCEYCPTSFHAECLNIDPPEGNYMCEDCETGRLPLYGEMVWVKLGQYRWWPGMILHPSEIPENIMSARHELGDFVVRFFGQYDHYWVNRGRVFPYQEGDSGRVSSNKSKINADFILAIQHAQRAYAILKTAPTDIEETQDIEQSLRPPHYVKLKSNKNCGGKAAPAPRPPAPCDCDPAGPAPCGPHDHCLNRMLLTECGPWCRAGERCMNRAFEKRLYPRLEPYRTPHRGWGLRTLEDIRAGQFVIEYVGELISEDELHRRIRRKHELRDENYYFLTLDKERIIDAGPKGNVARFMNHCCEPNCETQKWTVLGDVRVGLFAVRDIPANSEVTFNYNLECTGIEKKRCMCGAPRCSGYIGAKPKQEESQPKKGKDGKVKRQYNKKKKPEESPSTNKIKKKLGRPPKPKELTDLEKDVLIIKNATSLSSDEASRTDEKTPTSRRKRISSTTELSIQDNSKKDVKSLKRKRDSNSTEAVLCDGLEPNVKKLKSEKPSEVGD